MRKAILLSIRPRFAQQIFMGSKTVELRRRAPRLESGDVVLVYETSPTKAIVGWATVKGVETTTPSALWARVKDEAGVTRSEFDAYFAGAATATAIYLFGASKLKAPVELDAMRKLWPWLRPPQSYRYVSMFGQDAQNLSLAPPT
jgi:predicted transcriptional regulator